MKSELILAILCAALLSLQCENDRFIEELPPYPEHAVVNFVGEDNHQWSGTVSVNEKVLLQIGEYPFDIIDNAVINLYEDGIFLETLSMDHSGDSHYRSKINFPRPGHQYNIEVFTDQFGMSTASYLQPLSIASDTFSYKILGLHPVVSDLYPPDSYDLELHLTFTDPPGPDFYEIFITYHDDGSYLGGGQYSFTSNEPAYKLVNDYRNISGFLLDDKLFDGKVANLTFQETWGAFYAHPEIAIYGHTIEIRHLSKEYYEYRVALNRQRSIRNDPYAQPVVVPNNIINGFGVFGGVTSSRTLFKVK